MSESAFVPESTVTWQLKSDGCRTLRRAAHFSRSRTPCVISVRLPCRRRHPALLWGNGAPSSAL